jgi:hypothetical protein
MIPVMQTRTSGPHPNCFTACLASVLELDIADVPDFYKIEPASKAMKGVNTWLHEKGLQLITLRSAEELLPKAYLLAEGLGPRGLRHCVVFFGKQLVHDPHPGQKGLLSIDVFRLFVAVDPHKVLRCV